MKVEELRIGNLVKIGGEIDRLELCDFVDIHEHKTIWQYEPIPLTEEWLLKFGFVKAKFSSEYWSHYSLINGWNVALSHHTEESSGVNKGLVYWGDNYVGLKYVHQLQNLYFALNNKEL